jgi:type IV secretory pathway VirB10-like protein
LARIDDQRFLCEIVWSHRCTRSPRMICIRVALKQRKTKMNKFKNVVLLSTASAFLALFAVGCEKDKKDAEPAKTEVEGEKPKTDETPKATDPAAAPAVKTDHPAKADGEHPKADGEAAKGDHPKADGEAAKGDHPKADGEAAKGDHPKAAGDTKKSDHPK